MYILLLIIYIIVYGLNPLEIGKLNIIVILSVQGLLIILEIFEISFSFLSRYIADLKTNKQKANVIKFLIF